MKKQKTLKIDKPNAVAAAFGSTKRKISGFFYDLSVKAHDKFSSNKGQGIKLAKKSVRKRNAKIFYFSLIALPFIQFLIFYVGVNINSIIMSFQKFTMIEIDGIPTEILSFSGIENYLRFFSEFGADGIMLTLLKNSLFVFVIGTFVGTPLALFFSYYIYKKFPLNNFFKVVLFIPSIISTIVTVTMFSFIAGRVPVEIAKMFGVSIDNPMSNPNLRLPLVMVYNVWVSFGTSTVMYSSAMSRVPDSIVEYGKLEGLSPFKEFWYVIMPLIMQTFITFFVVSIASIFINQANLYAFFSNQADINIQTFGYYLFNLTKLGSTMSEFPYAAAAGIAFTVFAVPITLGAKWALDKFFPAVEY